jgi:hypothetical protein
LIAQYLSLAVRWALARLCRKNHAAERKPSKEDLNEVEAVLLVRGMCLTARAAAEILATDPENTDANRAYQVAKAQCIAVAERISDTFYRDTAFHFIYVFCQRASDDAAAQSILDRIATYEIRGNILDGRPALFD